MEDRDIVSNEDAFYQQFDSNMLRQRTIMIGEVISFDGDKNTVVVQPSLQRLFDGDESPSNLPIINDVPACFFGSGGFWITTKPKKGDNCLLFISDRSIERWKLTGGIVSPGKKRHHDMTDAVAYFGLNSTNNAIPNIEPDCLHLRSKDGQSGIKIKDDSIEVHHNNFPVVTMSVDSVNISIAGVNVCAITSAGVAFSVPVTAPSFTDGGGIVLGTHTHTGDSGGTTSAPL